MQNRYLAFKEQLNTRTRPEEIISTVPDLTSRTQDSSTATTAFSTPLNPFNVTPELTQAAISQKPDKESLTPPPPLNPAFLTPPPTVETPSQQGPKRKRRRIQFVNYLDDHKAHGKQLRKRRHKKFKPLVQMEKPVHSFIDIILCCKPTRNKEHDMNIPCS